jgi:hypothetical protein
MKIFINNDILEKFTLTSELLLLLGLHKSYPSEPPHCYNHEHKNRYYPLLEYSNKHIHYTDDITDCDVIVLPYKYKSFSNDTFLQELYMLSLRCNKPLLCFYNDDNDTPLDTPTNIHVYRTSFYYSTKKMNEYALTAFSPDFFKGDYLEEPVLSIGYCGHIDHGRKKYLGQFLQSDIQTNFILRKGFWAPGINKTRAMQEFNDTIQNNLFTFCYRGAGNFSYRLYQTLMMGRIPILINTDCVFPFSEQYNLQELGIIIDEKDIINNNIDIIQIIKEYYKTNKDRLVDIQKNNRIIWETYFSPVGFCDHICKKYTQ